MKNQVSKRKWLQHIVVAMALILGLGMFFASEVMTSHAFVDSYAINVTSSNTTYGTVAQNGTVDANGTGIYLSDSDVVLTASPKAGYYFVGWKEGSTVISTESSLSFTASADRTLVGSFAKIGTPTITSAYSVKYDSVKLIWTKVTGASHYEIYRATTANGSYSKVDTATGVTYTNSGLTSGKTYYYKVKAVATANTTITVGTASAYKSAKPIPSTPAVTVAPASYTSLKVSWGAVSGATAYNVYQATSATGTYSYIGTTIGTSYTKGSLTTGKTYYYKVKAYRLVGTTKVYGFSSSYKYSKPIPIAPTASVITYKSTSAKVSWNAVAGASKYQIYRSTTSDGVYSWVATVSYSTKSYVNTGLTNGKTYYYKVRAAHLEGSSYVYGLSSPVKSVKLGSIYYSGTYKVGVDIPAGEYLLKGTDYDSYAYVSLDAAGELYLAEAYPYPNQYLTLTTGQYVEFDSLKAYPIAQAPLVPTSGGKLIVGQYKVGRDIPAGEYVLYPDLMEEMVFFEITKDSKANEFSYIGMNMGSGAMYVTVLNGQYLNIYATSLGYPIADAPPVDTSSGELSSGMYKVGRDLPVGTYTLTPLEWGACYQIYNDANHSIDEFWETTDVLTTTDIVLTEGQYIILEGCKLTL